MLGLFCMVLQCVQQANSSRTEREAETETILYRLGSEFNRKL